MTSRHGWSGSFCSLQAFVEEVKQAVLALLGADAMTAEQLAERAVELDGVHM
jgi:hypothetical protein